VKLYDYAAAPNPRRVRVYLAEKGLSVPLGSCIAESIELDPALANVARWHAAVASRPSAKA
jgi:glutathione S-transferase